MVLLEGIVPAGVLVAMLLLMFGSLRRWGFSEPHARLARGALSAGLLAFAAHNFLEHTLWMPATATVFWIAAGASAGVAARPQPLPRAAGAVLAAALVVAAILAGWLIWRPVWRASALTLQARAQWSAGQAAAALASLDRAVDADPRDGTAAADLARAALSAGLDRDGRPAATRAATAAELAACRQPSSAHAALLATARWYQAEPSEMLCAWRGRMGDLNVLRDQLAAELLRRPDNIPLASALAEILHLLGQDEAAYSLLKSALDRSGKVFPKALDHLGDLAFWTGRAGEAHAAWGQYLSTSPGLADPPARNAAVAAMTQAVAMDPMSARLRMDLAEMLCALGRPADAAAQADRAAALDAAQPPDSDLRLNPAEHARLAALKAKIAVGKR